MTKQITTIGIKSDGCSVEETKIIIRLTQDQHGKTLSLSDDKNIMLVVSCTEIEKLLN